MEVKLQRKEENVGRVIQSSHTFCSLNTGDDKTPERNEGNCRDYWHIDFEMYIKWRTGSCTLQSQRTLQGTGSAVIARRTRFYKNDITDNLLMACCTLRGVQL